MFALLGHTLDVESDIGEQLFAARWVHGAADRGHLLLAGLDRTAGVREGDRKADHERRADDLSPLVLGEIVLRCHVSHATAQRGHCQMRPGVGPAWSYPVSPVR